METKEIIFQDTKHLDIVLCKYLKQQKSHKQKYQQPKGTPTDYL